MNKKIGRGKQLAVAGMVGSAVIFSGIGNAFGADAPTSFSEAVGVQVADVLTVSGTTARAAGDTGSASAEVVSVGGSTVIGGSQAGPGKSGDVLIDTGVTALGRLEVAPWSTEVTQSATNRHAESDSAVARAMLIDPDTVVLGVLESHSSADHNSGVSTSKASSDGVRLVVGGPSGLRIILLHSEMDSSGKGFTAPLAVNDTWIAAQSTSSSCLIDLTPTLGVGCLSAVGGLGETTASLVGFNIADALSGKGVAATAAGGTGSDTAVLPADITRAAPASTDDGMLPRTGSEVALLAAFALALMALGAAVVRMGHVVLPAKVRTARH